MTGYIHTINRRRGLLALATDRNGFTIVKLGGSDPVSLCDRLSWDDETALGAAVYFNATKGMALNVNVQAHGVVESQVREWLGL